MTSRERITLAKRLAAASVAATLGVLAGAASDSRSSTTGGRLALVAASPLAAEREGIAGRVRIEVRLGSARTGTFKVRGAISDTGSLKVSQRVVAGRLQVTGTLAGRRGTIRVRAVRTCSAAAGTWKVLSGVGDYAGLSGGGAASGGPRCKGARYPVRATYTGLVRAPEPGPPPPVAQAGRYGGATSLREEVIFDVDQSGRTVTGLRLVVTAPCSSGSPLATRRVSMSLAGPHAIGPDRSFSVRVESWWTGGVTGRFTSPTMAEGTAEVTTTVTASSTNPTYTCSADVSWRASLPPPAATPGTYCGSTTQGPRICLDVSPSGREVARVEVGIVAQCLPSGQFELTLRFGATPIGGHLGFSQRATSFEGLASGEGSITGSFDPDGAGATGRVVLFHAGLEHEGRRYACRSASATWTARR